MKSLAQMNFVITFQVCWILTVPAYPQLRHNIVLDLDPKTTKETTKRED